MEHGTGRAICRAALVQLTSNHSVDEMLDVLDNSSVVEHTFDRERRLAAAVDAEVRGITITKSHVLFAPSNVWSSETIGQGGWSAYAGSMSS